MPSYKLESYGIIESKFYEGDVLIVTYIPNIIKALKIILLLLFAKSTSFWFPKILDILQIEHLFNPWITQRLYDYASTIGNMSIFYYILIMFVSYVLIIIARYTYSVTLLIIVSDKVRYWYSVVKHNCLATQTIVCNYKFPKMVAPKLLNVNGRILPEVTLLRKYENKTVTIPKVDSKTAGYITETLATVELVSHTVVPPHIRDNAVRHIVNEYVISKLPIGKFCLVMDNPKYYDPDGKRFIIPVIDGKDNKRRAERMKFIEENAAKGIHYNYTYNKYEDDTFAADVVVGVQANYDQATDKFFPASYKKQVKTIYLVLNFNITMLTQKSGSLKMLNMSFERKWNIMTNREELKMWFNDESGDVYTHDYEEYMKYITTKNFVVSDKHYYVNNIEHQFEDVVILCYTLATETQPVNEVRHYNNINADKFIYLHIPLASGLYYIGVKRTIRVVVPRSLYIHLLASSTTATGKVMNIDSLIGTSVNVGEAWYSDYFHPYAKDYHQDKIMKVVVNHITKLGIIQRQLDDYSNAYRDIKLWNLVSKLTCIITGGIETWRLTEEKTQMVSDLESVLRIHMGTIVMKVDNMIINENVLTGEIYDELRTSALKCTIPSYTCKKGIDHDIKVMGVNHTLTRHRRYEPRFSTMYEATYIWSTDTGTNLEFLKHIAFVIFDDDIIYTNTVITSNNEILLVFEVIRDDKGIVGYHRCKSMEMQDALNHIATTNCHYFVGNVQEIYWGIRLHLEHVNAPKCFFNAYGNPQYSISGLGSETTAQTRYYTAAGFKSMNNCYPTDIKIVALRESVGIIDKTEIYIPREEDTKTHRLHGYGNALVQPFPGNDEDIINSGTTNKVSTPTTSTSVVDKLRLIIKDVSIEDIKTVEQFCYIHASHVWKIRNNLAVMDYCNRNVIRYKNIIHYEKILNGVITLQNDYRNKLRVVESFKLQVLEITDERRRICLMSIYEILHYTIISEQSILNMFDGAYRMLHASSLTSFKKIKVYDTKKGRFITDLPERIPTIGYCNGEYINVTWDNKCLTLVNLHTTADYILFSDELLYLREKQILENFLPILDVILEYKFEATKFSLHRGPPGCGKTTLIKSRHSVGTDLVFTECKAGNEAYKNWLTNKALSQYYLTYDAALINKTVVKANTSWNDEAFMPHFGVICLIIYKCQIKHVNLVGDPSQIPFLSRVAQYKLHYEKIDSKLLDEVKIVYHTWRLPRSAINYMRVLVPDIFTYSNIIGTVKVEYITKPFVIANVSVILTFTKSEKWEMIALNPNIRVYTVNEAQGLDFVDVALVRLRTHFISLYYDLAQILVALSRHKRHFTYYTPVKDKISTLLESKIYETEKNDITIDDLYTVIQRQNIGIVKHIKAWYSLKTTDIPMCAREYILSTGITNETKINKPSIDVYYLDFPSSVQECRLITNKELQSNYNAIFGIVDERVLEKELNSPITLLERNNINVTFWKLINSEIKTKDKNQCVNYLTPVLKTRQPKPYSDTAIETEVSIESRVRDAPDQSLLVTKDVPNESIKRFYNTYIEKRYFDLAEKLFDYASEEQIENWYGRLSGDRKARVDAETEMKKFYGSGVYVCHIKRDHKPNTSKENYGIQGGQLIAAMPSLETFKFACHFKTFISRLKCSLKSKFMIFDGYKLEHLNGFINKWLKTHNCYIPKEIDFSKFDKSQNELLGEIQLQIFRDYGLPEFVVERWREWHITNILRFKSFGISVKTTYQRRSGDIMTFMGNTLVSMIVLAYGYDYTDCILGVFAGDDSIYFLKENAERIDESKIAQEVFNLEAKLLNYPNAPMFISKILIYCEGYYYFIPDALKGVTRLGRSDLQCGEHVEEYYKSFKDNYKMYGNEKVRVATAEVLKERYNKIAKNKIKSYLVFCEFIANLLVDKDKFVKLFFGERELWKRKLPKKEQEFTSYLTYDELLM